jgi:DNA-binding GntR family transcriptional regulator
MTAITEPDTRQFGNLAEVVYAHLQASIFNGTLQAGQPIRQEDIAFQLGISRVPVREALKWLESQGMAVFRPRCGYTVADLDIDDVRDIFDIRLMLEERGGYVAAERRTDDDIAEVKATLLEMDDLSTPTQDNINRFSDANRRFHKRLFAASKRKHLCDTLDLFRDQVERLVRIDALTPGRLVEAQEEHHDIFVAFEEGDSWRLSKLCAAHCEHTRDRLIASLQQRQPGETRKKAGATAKARSALKRLAGREGR